jgi:hypothetical protein
VAIALGATVAVLLSLYFWFPLWTGGGLVGSDVYAYTLPQKAYFAERLRAGELPLWNNRIGFGYPLVAESQTGVFYPPNWIFYRALAPPLDLNGAFSACLVFHYVLAFLVAMLYARQMGLTRTAAGLAALVYTYAWFPPRVCLEWTIVGGAWLPLALWSAESFLQTRFWRYAFLLTATLAIQMLAGHFVLAFITQLTLAAYVPLRLWFHSTDEFTAGRLEHAPANGRSETAGTARIRAAVPLGLAVGAAFLVAAVQLFPTWELKQHSQRATVTGEHDPAIGSIPLRYYLQIILPWVWYPEEASFQETVTPNGPRTNRVEAHLYFGMIPLLLMSWRGWEWRRHGDRRLAVWIILGVATLIYTTGWLVPLTRHLPGFSFFEGPARFGVVTTLAAGLIAGSGFDSLRDVICRKCGALPPSARPVLRLVLGAALFAGTAFDLRLVSNLVTYAVVVSNPPAKYLAESPLRDALSKISQPVRIVSEGKNLTSLLGGATIPVYLGLAPAQYFDSETAFPEPWPWATLPTREQLDWLHRAGVTHYLSFRPVDRRAWAARLVWEGSDQFLNTALARGADDRFYLYELDGSRGRVAFGDAQPGQSASIVHYSANQVVIQVESPAGGRLILTDLAWPGWQAAVEGGPVDLVVVEKMYRGVDLGPGIHTVTWSYRPATVYWGAGISGATLLILMAIAHVRFWHPQILKARRLNSAQ